VNISCDAVGTPPWCDVPLIRQFRPKKPEDSFYLVLPGGVSSGDGSPILGIIPSARVVCPSGRSSVIDAVVDIAAKDCDVAAKVLSNWDTEVGRDVPLSFFMIVDGEGLTYKDVCNGALNKQFGRESPGALTFRFGVIFDEGTPVISHRIEGHLFGRATQENINLTSSDDPTHPWPYFDCHSHWYSVYLIDRRGRHASKRTWITKCFGGGCDPGEDCTCGDPPNHGRICDGLNTCWCQ